MARGLSGLQKKILLMAYESRRRGRDGHGVDLRYPDVLREWWGWEPVRSGWAKDKRSPALGMLFSKTQIGEREYRSAQSSLSRAVRRLEERGLVTRARLFGHGTLDLTEQGVEAAANFREL
jgi:hypothetical protein